MMQHNVVPEDQSSYEYHGNTMIEMTRRQDGVTIEREWLLFDTVEEAQEFLNENAG